MEKMAEQIDESRKKFDWARKSVNQTVKIRLDKILIQSYFDHLVSSSQEEV